MTLLAVAVLAFLALVVIAAFAAAYRYARLPDRHVPRATVGGLGAFATAVVLALAMQRQKMITGPHFVIVPAPAPEPPQLTSPAPDGGHPCDERPHSLLALPGLDERQAVYDREMEQDGS